MDPREEAGTSKNPQGKHIRSGQRLMAYNAYVKYCTENSKSASIKLASKLVGIGESSMWAIVKEMENSGVVRSPIKKRKRETTCTKLDEFQKNCIRRHVHSFYFKNELPTCSKVLTVIEADDTLPAMKRTTLWKILKVLGFKWEKRSRKSILIERNDIVLWRRNYLKSIRRFRTMERKIYYLDETWVNAGHTKVKVWKDTTVTDARQAFIDGLSRGLQDPSGKGKRLIVLHIGSETGFVDNGLLLFESKKTGDYHEDMNSKVFSEWMTNILPSLEPGCVIVMDNAPYHSVKTDKIPNYSWRKDVIIEWLTSKDIVVDNNLLKVELLDMAKKYMSDHPTSYVIDEMITASGRTVLRLPPYHCNLNPIELVWAQVKHHVAANNKTFKLPEVKTLLLQGLDLVNAQRWENCVKHVIAEEDKMYELDNIVEDLEETLIITANTGSSSEPFTDTDSE